MAASIEARLEIRDRVSHSCFGLTPGGHAVPQIAILDFTLLWIFLESIHMSWICSMGYGHLVSYLRVIYVAYPRAKYVILSYPQG